MSWGELLECCERCPALSSERTCTLLVAPTPSNRRDLLSMPCRVEHVLASRLRAHGPNVAKEALARWLDPSWSADEVSRSFGRAPRDARLWLTSWPVLFLGKLAERAGKRHDGDLVGVGDLPEADRTVADPSLGVRVSRALDGVRRIDPISHAIVSDLMRNAYDARAWAALLGTSEAAVAERMALALWRYLVVFHGVLAQLSSDEARAALAARRLSPGEPDEARALASTRAALGQPGLSQEAFAELYRAGAAETLDVLARPDVLGPSLAGLKDAFCRALRIA